MKLTSVQSRRKSMCNRQISLQRDFFFIFDFGLNLIKGRLKGILCLILELLESAYLVLSIWIWLPIYYWNFISFLCIRITLTINLSLLESPWTDPSEAPVSYKGRYEHQSFQPTIIIAILLTKPALIA